MFARVFRILNALGLYPLARAARIWLDHHTPWGRRRLRALKAFYAQFLGPGDLCFDVGGNVGDRAELFLEIGARVVCIEPIDVCVESLRRRFRENGRFQIVPKALGEREGTAEFHICEYNLPLSTLSTKWVKEGRHANEYEWGRKVQVPVTTLDALIEAHGAPRFCKIDVEGAEELVLKGLSRPIPYLSLEFHGELLDETKKCLDRIQAIGPAAFNCTIHDSVEMLLPAWVGADVLFAKLKSMEGPSVWGDIYATFEKAAALA